MFENKFFLLFINFLWMVGLFGALFALVYMAQYRRKHWWNIGYTYNVPRLLAPLYGSLALFVAGLALQAYATQRLVSLWVAVIWGVLTFFFLFRMIDVVLAALQNGWDSVMAGPQADDGQRPGFSIWSGSVIVLLLANLLVLGWWGSVQLNAGTLTLPWAERGLTEPKRAETKLTETKLTETTSVPVTRQQRSLIKQAGQAQSVQQTNSLTPTLSLASAITDVLVPAVSTLPASELKVTPTPATESANPQNLPVVEFTVQPLTVTVQPAAPTEPIILVPTATPPPTPTPLPTPTPTPTVGPALTVQSATGANVRTAPARTAPVVTLLPDGAVAVVLGRTADNHWFSVELPDGVQGWIADEVVKLNGKPTVLPILTPPATP